jgi:hypothetical protein
MDEPDTKNAPDPSGFFHLLAALHYRQWRLHRKQGRPCIEPPQCSDDGLVLRRHSDLALRARRYPFSGGVP